MTLSGISKTILSRETNLKNSSFVKSDNYESIFRDSNLENSSFESSRFSNVEFTDTIMKNANLLDIYPIESKFINVEFNDAQINTCLDHDLLSRVFNKILRSIDDLGLEFFENLIVSTCNN